MKRIKVGIIGQGRSGRDIHRHLFETQVALQERFEVVAVADPIPERRKIDGITPSPDFREYDDYKAMIENKEIELFVNASRSPWHIPISIELLQAGRDVICEKPLARSVADVEKLETAVRESGRFFAVFQQTRFRPLFSKTFEIVKSGVLGRIVMVKIEYNSFGRRWDWQTIQDMCAGELLNTGPHPLDLALQFYGDGEADPEQIFCKMDRANTFGDAEDHVKLILAGSGHPTVDLEVSRCCMYPGSTFNVYGTNGGLKANGAEIDWRYFDPNEAPEQKLVRGTLEGPGRLPRYCGEKLKFFEEHWKAPEAALGFDDWGTRYYRNIYDAYTAGAPLKVSLEQVKRQIRVIEECHRQNPLPKFVKLS